MIIEKTYPFNDIPEEYKLVSILLNNYQRTIINSIIKDSRIFEQDSKSKSIIFCGVDGLIVLQAQNYYFSSNSQGDIILLNGTTGLVGTLMTREVYYDTRLENNKIIIGEDYWKINHYIKTKGRKEKLEKLECANLNEEIT